jgi:hypothetical protein
MAVDAHVQELSSKHRRLEQDIAQEYQHPSVDQMRITALKRRKLRIKDEISRLAQSQAS